MSSDLARGTGQAAGALGVGMLGMVMMAPNLNFQAQGTAPSGGPAGSVPQVGGVAGGGLPSNTGIPTLSLSLALVPLGLMAVAVFPPFERLIRILSIHFNFKM